MNTDVNTADNADENTDVNTDVNTADNADENTDVNTDVNTADNGTENTADNQGDNTSDNTSDNTEHPVLNVVPDSVEEGDDVTVIGEKFTPDGTVEFVVRNVNGEGDPVQDVELTVDKDGKFKHEFSTDGLPEGIYIVEVTDPETGKVYNEYFQVKPSDEASLIVGVDITPNRLIKGESGEVTGKEFTPGGVVEIKQSALGEANTGMVDAVAAALPADVTANEAGDISFMVDTSDIELGNYILLLTDVESGSYGFTTFTVVAAESTADNSADNTDANTSDNADANTDANTDVNTSDNADAN
ncbi:hypothetical protein ACTXI4_18320, partial [Glutamicibacter ardleyensis]